MTQALWILMWVWATVVAVPLLVVAAECVLALLPRRRWLLKEPLKSR